MNICSFLTAGDENVSIWDRVWTGDRYAIPAVRATRAQRRLTSFGLTNASIPRGARVLDVGCGTGDSLAARCLPLTVPVLSLQGQIFQAGLQH